MAVLSVACLNGHFDIMVYLVEHGANVSQTDNEGINALHCASIYGDLSSVKYLLEHGARATERSNGGMTALLFAAEQGSLEMIRYLLSSEGGASITETDKAGDTALLLAANSNLTMVQWLLEYGGARIDDTDINGTSVWTIKWEWGLPAKLRDAHTKDDKGAYISIDGELVPNGELLAVVSMLRVIVLHGGPPESLTADVAPSLQQIVHNAWRAAVGTAPGIPRATARPFGRALSAACTAPGPGIWLRGAHHRRNFGHGARESPAIRKATQAGVRPAVRAPLCAPASGAPARSSEQI
jgi:hypothetical protein